MKKIRNVVDVLLNTKTSINAFIGSFLGCVFLRVFIEQFIAVSSDATAYDRIIEYVHNVFFFLITFLLLWLFLSYLLKVNPKKLTTVFSLSSILIIFPPLFDIWRTRGGVFWSFYLLSSPTELFRQFLSFFGNLPSGIEYFGTRIVFISAILLFSGLVFIKTKKIFKTIAAFFGTYIILFFMGSFPSLFVYLWAKFFECKNITDVHSFNVAQFFGIPGKIFGVEFADIRYSFAYKLEILYFLLLMFLLTLILFVSSRSKFIAVLKNFRYPQVIYHSGLFLVGMGLAFLQYRDNIDFNLFSVSAVLVLLVSIWLAWKASVIINDIHDFNIDAITNSNRPLQKGIFSVDEYLEFGLICFLLSLLGGITIGLPFFFLLLVYQVIAYFYSAPPFRLKRFPGIASLVSALASLMILFLGFILVSDDQTIHSLSPRISFLLLISYTLCIPIKDFKDIEGDKKDNVWTIPVIFGEETGKIIIGANMFISYMLSVFFLNEFRLFWWALLFGIITFLVMTNKKIEARRLPFWIIGLVFLYGLVLVKVVFS